MLLCPCAAFDSRWARALAGIIFFVCLDWQDFLANAGACSPSVVVLDQIESVCRRRPEAAGITELQVCAAIENNDRNTYDAQNKHLQVPDRTCGGLNIAVVAIDVAWRGIDYVPAVLIRGIRFMFLSSSEPFDCAVR